MIYHFKYSTLTQNVQRGSAMRAMSLMGSSLRDTLTWIIRNYVQAAQEGLCQRTEVIIKCAIRRKISSTKRTIKERSASDSITEESRGEGTHGVVSCMQVLLVAC